MHKLKSERENQPSSLAALGRHSHWSAPGFERLSASPSLAASGHRLEQIRHSGPNPQSSLVRKKMNALSSLLTIPSASMFTKTRCCSSFSPLKCHYQSADNTASKMSTNQKLQKLQHKRRMLRPIDQSRNMTCQAQAASSDLGMPSTGLDLTRSPFITLLNTERVKVALMVAFAMALCNADRVVMSVAIMPLSTTYNWSTSFAGIIQSSFLWGYMVSPIPGGMLADRYGGKVVMGWGVIVWSLATMFTPWAASHSMGMLLAMRALMGLAEGVAMPCMNNMVCKWFPGTERARAVGLTMAGFHLGSVGGLILTPVLMKNYGLSGPFWVFGLLGVVWLSLWAPSVYKDPQSNPSISSSEYAHIEQGSEGLGSSSKEAGKGGLPPFRQIFSKMPTWAIIVANAMNNWGYFILLSWMPVYFNTVLGVNLKEAAWFSAAPWAMMGLAGFFAGACSDRLIQMGVSITNVRKIMQSIGFVGPAVALLCLNTVRDPAVASAWLTAALGLSAFSQAGFLVNHQEIGPRYAGFLHGVSNTAGTFAAIISTVGTGYFIERLGSIQAFLTVTAVLYVISTVFWNMFASGERIFH